MKNYKCEICGKEFEKQIEYTQHILNLKCLNSKYEANRKIEEVKIKAQKKKELKKSKGYVKH